MSASTDILTTEKPLPCPKCSQLFRLPEGFTEKNALACPHCEEQVTGQQILESMAPTARMVQVEGQDAPAIQTGAAAGSGSVRQARSFDEQDFVIPKPLKTAVRSSSRRRRSESADDSKSGTSRSENRSRSSSSSRRKKKKKEANPLGEFGKVVFGGILALPIAQLILWWGFNADPLGIAPKAISIAPFVVPPKMRPVTAVEDNDGASINKDMPGNQTMHDDKVPMTLTPDG